MSEQKKPSTFLTEGSNLEGGGEKENKKPPRSAAESQLSNEIEDDDGESLNDDDEDEEDDDDDDEEYLDDTEDYTNPFSQLAPCKGTAADNAGAAAVAPENVNIRDKEVPEEERPLSALAPKIFDQDDSQLEISSTPAFQCLEELFQNGKLTGTQVAQLKAKYVELHLTLKK